MIGKVLILHENSEDASLLHKGIREKTHFVSRVQNFDEFNLDALIKFKPDLIVVDYMSSSPKASKTCQMLKKEEMSRDIPIYLIMNTTSSYDLQLPFSVHDVIFKPIRVEECVTRLVLTFKKMNLISDKNVIRSGQLEIDVSSYEVHIGGHKIDLTYTEYELLKFFMTHPTQVFTRDVLLNKVWGYEYFGGARTVDVHVRRLRAKIEIKNQKFIETIRNIGYKFIGDGNEG